MIWFWHIRHTTTKSDIMNICAILEKLEDIRLHLIDSSKHSNQHDQIKIDKVNHCNINHRQWSKKIFIALVDWYNYQNWTSTSWSKYVPLKIMDEITYPRTIEVWELPLKKIITHVEIYDGCDYLSLLGLKVILVDKRGPGYLWVKYQHKWHN